MLSWSCISACRHMTDRNRCDSLTVVICSCVKLAQENFQNDTWGYLGHHVVSLLLLCQVFVLILKSHVITWCLVQQLRQPITAELVTQRKIAHQLGVQHHSIVHLLNSTSFAGYFVCSYFPVDLPLVCVVSFYLTEIMLPFLYVDCIFNSDKVKEEYL